MGIHAWPNRNSRRIHKESIGNIGNQLRTHWERIWNIKGTHWEAIGIPLVICKESQRVSYKEIETKPEGNHWTSIGTPLATLGESTGNPWGRIHRDRPSLGIPLCMRVDSSGNPLGAHRNSLAIHRKSMQQLYEKPKRNHS